MRAVRWVVSKAVHSVERMDPTLAVRLADHWAGVTVVLRVVCSVASLVEKKADWWALHWESHLVEQSDWAWDQRWDSRSAL